MSMGSPSFKPLDPTLRTGAADSRLAFRPGDTVKNGTYTDMVRFSGGRRHGRQEDRRMVTLNRSRSKSRSKYASDSYTPMIADYLSNPMFDTLHNKHRERSISLMARPLNGGGRRGNVSRHTSHVGPSFISTCKVLWSVISVLLSILTDLSHS